MTHMYVGDISGRRALYSPDALAIIDAGKTPHLRLTYRDLDERARRLANWLANVVGVCKGDRVAILASDGVEHLDLFFACGKLGATVVCLNWRLHAQELAELGKMTTPRAILHSDQFVEAAHTMQQVLSGENSPAPILLNFDTEYEAAMASSSTAPIYTPTLSEEDIACLIFTGGTTGLPKAAQVSYRMIAWNSLNTIIHDITHGDVTVNVFPMFHTGGLLVYTTPLMILGGTVVLVKRFDPAQVLELLQTYQATFFAAVPTMYQMLTQAPNWDSADLSHLRFCTSGGAALPVPLVEKFQTEKGVRFKQGFGMSEFGPGIFAFSATEAMRRAGSIGRPTFFTDARIVDDNNQPVPPNTVGELVLRGPTRASGYYNNPEASAASLDAEGWFHSGDLARCDEEHYFYIVDRKKDMFISGGENVYPVEIEQALYKHPAVAMCAVVGVPDAQWSEVGLACVVLKPNQTASEQELIDFLRTQLARYKVPRSIQFLDAMPISGAGKILKRELRERFVK